ncbi:uncharacterized protein LOC109830954 [Asparagus officinalis]|uniref:uncharacterized protein LOC109830954 n=1 Tax=Asparagus officinalis TaxID=4686 RepID=UPI00098E0B1B|nr:uncharacterized protein LOC109830954 [Asparagus officinalis]
MGDLKPTTISLQLADRSVKRPVGILEDVSIQVGKFYIPVDFVILEIEEDSEIPIILRRPFLTTAGAIIDVKNGKLSLNIGDEKVNFDLFSTTKFPLIDNTCCRNDTIDMVVRKDFTRDISNDPLDKCLAKDEASVDDDQEITSYVTMLDESPTYTKTTYIKGPDAVAETAKELNAQGADTVMSKNSKNSPEQVCEEKTAPGKLLNNDSTWSGCVRRHSRVKKQQKKSRTSPSPLVEVEHKAHWAIKSIHLHLKEAGE